MFNFFSSGEADLSCSSPEEALLLLAPCDPTYSGGVEQEDGGVNMHSSNPGEEIVVSSSKWTGLGEGHQPDTGLSLSSSVGLYYPGPPRAEGELTVESAPDPSQVYGVPGVTTTDKVGPWGFLYCSVVPMAVFRRQ